MKITLLSVENSISAIGFRKIAAIAKKEIPDVEVCFYTPSLMTASIKRFFENITSETRLDNKSNKSKLLSLSKQLSKSDLVCISSMTPFANCTKEIIKLTKTLNPKTYIVWGGIHPILNPNDAIQSADAICIGEGEIAFQEFLASFKDEMDFTKTRNFWYKINDKIIRNPLRPIHTPAQMGSFPHQLYAEDETIWKSQKGFVPITLDDYLVSNSLTYTTIWSVGCPNRCIYCANSKLIENDSNHKNLRHPSVDYLISEIQSVLQKHPHISNIHIADDNFFSIDYETMKEFALKWNTHINIPFMIGGTNPNNITRDKMTVLVGAGMQFIRVGIQNGSERILKFYKRPYNRQQLKRAVSIVSEFSTYMIPPYYDIILDNPLETRQDIIENLELLYDLPRPYQLNLYALRVIPSTELEKKFKEMGITRPDISEGYHSFSSTFANAIVILLIITRIPIKVFKYLLNYAKPYTEKQSHFILTHALLRILWLIKMTIHHIRSMFFLQLPGKFGYFLWKLGIIQHFQMKRLYKAKKQFLEHSIK